MPSVIDTIERIQPIRLSQLCSFLLLGAVALSTGCSSIPSVGEVFAERPPHKLRIIADCYVPTFFTLKNRRSIGFNENYNWQLCKSLVEQSVQRISTEHPDIEFSSERRHTRGVQLGRNVKIAAVNGFDEIEVTGDTLFLPRIYHERIKASSIPFSEIIVQSRNLATTGEHKKERVDLMYRNREVPSIAYREALYSLVPEISASTKKSKASTLLLTVSGQLIAEEIAGVEMDNEQVADAIISGILGALTGTATTYSYSYITSAAYATAVLIDENGKIQWANVTGMPACEDPKVTAKHLLRYSLKSDDISPRFTLCI